jgi:hypothetical protein
MLNCPRCGAKLLEHEPSLRWKRWFECPECFGAWTVVVTRHVEICDCEWSHRRRVVTWGFAAGRVPRITPATEREERRNLRHA